MKYFNKEWYVRSKHSISCFQKAENLYAEYLCSNALILPKELIRDLHLHDAVLQGMHWFSDTLEMKFDVSRSASYVNGISFLNAEIVANDNPQEGDYWLFEEVYFINNVYVIHILFCDKFDIAKQIIIHATDISFSYDEMKRSTINTRKELVSKYKEASSEEKSVLYKKMKESPDL